MTRFRKIVICLAIGFVLGSALAVSARYDFIRLSKILPEREFFGVLGEDGGAWDQLWLRNTITFEGDIADESETIIALGEEPVGRNTYDLLHTGVVNKIDSTMLGVNSVTNQELDNSDDYVINSLDVTADSLFRGDVQARGEFGGKAELFFHNGTTPKTIALASGGAWVNVTGVSNGVNNDAAVFTLNGTSAEITVLQSLVYDIDAHISSQRNMGANETYRSTIAINGSPQIKCTAHRRMTNNAVGYFEPGCFLDLTANDVLTVLVNSLGGNDINILHLNLKVRQ